MSAEYPISGPDSDPFHIQEAKRFYERIKALSLGDALYSYASYFKFDKALVYLQDFPTPRFCDDDMILFPVVDKSFKFDCPSVKLMVLGEVLHHSTVGDVPGAFVGSDGLIYEADNRYVINSLGQTYREDTLLVEPDPEMVKEFSNVGYPHLDIAPNESDLGARMNPFDGGDFELIGHYLNRIDRGEFEVSRQY